MKKFNTNIIVIFSFFKFIFIAQSNNVKCNVMFIMNAVAIEI